MTQDSRKDISQRMSPKVDGYIRKNKLWQQELELLRAILLASELTEDIKWRAPCYTWAGKNVIILGAGKDSCVLSFLKGALLKDAQCLLVKAGPNTQAARIIRFTQPQEIVERNAILKGYVQEAIAIEKAGRKVQTKTSPEPVPDELQQAMDNDAAFKAAFKALTPGRQRGYILYFAAPKQSKTRASRIEKCTPQILEGKGFHDDYQAQKKMKK